MTDRSLEQRFLDEVLTNSRNEAILARWPALGLPGDAWLVAGCLFQTVWNLRSGKPPTANIKDYDLFYFDGTALDADAERAVQSRVEGVLGDLGVTVEAKNQARVHLWYENYFGHPYTQLNSARDGIERFLVPCTCVGVRPVAGGGLELYAPYGLQALYDGVLEPNPLVDHRPLFIAKANSYRERWPWLRVNLGAAAGGMV